jgi:hypothetical protein
MVFFQYCNDINKIFDIYYEKILLLHTFDSFLFYKIIFLHFDPVMSIHLFIVLFYVQIEFSSLRLVHIIFFYFLFYIHSYNDI